MTKIYILSTGCYDDYNIEFVTLDKRKAEKAVKLYGYELEVKEDGNDWMPFNRIIRLDENGKIVRDQKITYPTRTNQIGWLTEEIEETHQIGQEAQIWLVPVLRCQAYGKTRQEAVKLAKQAFKDKSNLPTTGKPRRKPENRINHLFDTARNSMTPLITGGSGWIYPRYDFNKITIGTDTPHGICSSIIKDVKGNREITMMEFTKINPIP